jgi:hypothetical protein
MANGPRPSGHPASSAFHPRSKQAGAEDPFAAEELVRIYNKNKVLTFQARERSRMLRESSKELIKTGRDLISESRRWHRKRAEPKR